MELENIDVVGFQHMQTCIQIVPIAICAIQSCDLSNHMNSFVCLAFVACCRGRNATREHIFRRSATGLSLHVFGVPSPLYRDLGEGALNLPQIVGPEFDSNGADVLVQAL
jgi:hypothetical protein